MPAAAVGLALVGVGWLAHLGGVQGPTAAAAWAGRALALSGAVLVVDALWRIVRPSVVLSAEGLRGSLVGIRPLDVSALGLGGVGVQERLGSHVVVLRDLGRWGQPRRLWLRRDSSADALLAAFVVVADGGVA